MSGIFDSFGPYLGLDMKMPKFKMQRGTAVGCHVCGKTNITLYNDGDQKICGKCRAEKEDSQNGHGNRA